jgi:hypothetical protein
MGPGFVSILIAIALTVVLSAVLGVQMERWNRGSVQSLPRVIMYVLNILFTACFVGYGEFLLVYDFIRKFSPP